MTTSAKSQYSVDIHFRGICSHFHSNVLPGIPHRVVLPDATAVRPGLLTGPESLVTKSNEPLDWLTYILLPHFSYAMVVDPITLSPQLPFLSVRGVLEDGFLFTSARLSIANAIQTKVTYPSAVEPLKQGPNSFFDVPQLTSFVPHYTYSTDVVLAGRASAYFDLYGGEVTAFMDGQSIRVRARVLTDGPPQLQVAPLAVLDQPVDVQTIPLTTDRGQLNATMVFGNSGVCSVGSEYDFLLHYLTSTAGIPRAVTQPPPGLPYAGDIDIDEILKILESILKSGWPPKVVRGPSQHFDLQASCSDSRYP